jgi:hypothetical protein
LTVAKLRDAAAVPRSKNAGPFQLTVDVMFDDEAAHRRVLASGAPKPARVGPLYGVEARLVRGIPFGRVRAVKATLPRRSGARGSGSACDRDVYGAQQHGPSVDVEIPPSGGA